MNQLVDLEKTNPSTSLFRLLFKPVFRNHLFPRKIAVIVLKIHAILIQQSCMQLALHLEDELINRVPVEEAPFSAPVGVEITVEEKP